MNVKDHLVCAFNIYLTYFTYIIEDTSAFNAHIYLLQ